MSIPTARRTVRHLIEAMRPHVGHQAAWVRQGDATIHCRQCDTKIIGPDTMIASGSHLLAPAEAEKARTTAAHWLRAQA